MYTKHAKKLGISKLHYAVLAQIIGSTNNIVDRHKQLAAIAYAKTQGIEPECRNMIRSWRAEWMAWQFVTQRQWQSRTRNPNKAVHHDSISIRESYVRC